MGIDGENIKVRLFGAFRDLWPEAEIALDVGQPSASVAEVRAALLTRLLGVGGRGKLSPGDLESLVNRSALADESRVLKLDDPVARGSRLAILPPVCGG